MIVVHVFTEDDASVVEQTLEKYKAKVARSASQNPIIEDVEYGVDSRRSSFANPHVPNPNLLVTGIKPEDLDIAKKFDQEPGGGVVKV